MSNSRFNFDSGSNRSGEEMEDRSQSGVYCCFVFAIMRKKVRTQISIRVGVLLLTRQRCGAALSRRATPTRGDSTLSASDSTAFAEKHLSVTAASWQTRVQTRSFKAFYCHPPSKCRKLSPFDTVTLDLRWIPQGDSRLRCLFIRRTGSCQSDGHVGMQRENFHALFNRKKGNHSVSVLNMSVFSPPSHGVFNHNVGL